MSRKGISGDNAPPESVWGRLTRASVHNPKFTTRQQARQQARHAVMDWMAFYNDLWLDATGQGQAAQRAPLGASKCSSATGRQR